MSLPEYLGFIAAGFAILALGLPKETRENDSQAAMTAALMLMTAAIVIAILQGEGF